MVYPSRDLPGRDAPKRHPHTEAEARNRWLNSGNPVVPQWPPPVQQETHRAEGLPHGTVAGKFSPYSRSRLIASIV
jgi:hypothetical protein